MKESNFPNIEFGNVEQAEVKHTQRELILYIEFASKSDFVDEFKHMAEKISDETLADILNQRRAKSTCKAPVEYKITLVQLQHLIGHARYGLNAAGRDPGTLEKMVSDIQAQRLVKDEEN